MGLVCALSLPLTVVLSRDDLHARCKILEFGLGCLNSYVHVGKSLGRLHLVIRDELETLGIVCWIIL